MFERAILNHQRRPWTMAVSLSLQSAAAGAIVLLSIMTIEQLPSVALPVPLPPLPRAPKPVEVVMTEMARTAQAKVSRVFTAPVRVPDRVAMIVEEVTAASVAEAVAGLAGTGLPAGVYMGNQNYTSGQFTTPPPPPVKPAEPAVRTPEPVRIVKLGGRVLEGKILQRVLPVYPQLARSARVSGTVKLEAIITRDGRVRELKALSGHPLLVKAALDAVKQWTYQPTLLNSEPVEVNSTIEVHFTLAQ